MHHPICSKNSSFLLSVHPSLREIFHKLYTSYDIALEPFSDRTSLYKLKLADTNYTYAFRLRITYCTKILLWDVIFNPNDLTRAPDFNFNNENFDEFVYKNDINKCLPDWVNWNVKNPESLASVIKSFVGLFTKFQELELPKVAALISEEYKALRTIDNYGPNDIELFVDTSLTHLLISLRIDVSELPEYVQNINEDGTLMNPMQDKALLVIIYHNEGKLFRVRLSPSARVDQFIRTMDVLRIPYSTNMSLADHIPTVTNLVQNYIDKAAFRFQFRREFIASILILKGKSITEYDAFHMKFISFLCEVEGSFFFMKINMDDKFPDAKATVEITSFHKFSINEENFTKADFDYDDCPEKIPDKMAIHVLGQLKNFIIKHLESLSMETE